MASLNNRERTSLSRDRKPYSESPDDKRIWHNHDSYMRSQYSTEINASEASDGDKTSLVTPRAQINIPGATSSTVSTVSEGRPRSNKPTIELLLSGPNPSSSMSKNGNFPQFFGSNLGSRASSSASASTSAAATPASFIQSASPATPPTSHSPSPDTLNTSDVKSKDEGKGKSLGMEKGKSVARVPEIIDLCDTDSDSGDRGILPPKNMHLHPELSYEHFRHLNDISEMMKSIYEFERKPRLQHSRTMRIMMLNKFTNPGFREFLKEELERKGSMQSLLNEDLPTTRVQEHKDKSKLSRDVASASKLTSNVTTTPSSYDTSPFTTQSTLVTATGTNHVKPILKRDSSPTSLRQLTIKPSTEPLSRKRPHSSLDQGVPEPNFTESPSSVGKSEIKTRRHLRSSNGNQSENAPPTQQNDLNNNNKIIKTERHRVNIFKSGNRNRKRPVKDGSLKHSSPFTSTSIGKSSASTPDPASATASEGEDYDFRSGPYHGDTSEIDSDCTEAQRDRYLIDYVRSEKPLEEEDFDLTVDMDSDAENALGEDEWDDEYWGVDVDWDNYEYKMGWWGERLGYDSCDSEEYAGKLKTCWPEEAIKHYLGYLHRHGIAKFMKRHLIDLDIPTQDLLHCFGVPTPKDRQKLDDHAHLPLLKAAIVRHTRHRHACCVYRRKTKMGMHKVIRAIRKAKSIMVLTGAGISTSCGIPDFRSRNGLYSQLSRTGLYALDDPQQMFDMNYFREDPNVFYSFAHKIYPSNFEPSPCHRFIKALEDRGKLCINFTQNIDTLENKAGIKKVFQCHGSFATASCINCRTQVPGEVIKDELMARKVPLCKFCNTEAQIRPKKKARRKKKKKPRNDGWESNSDEEKESGPLPKGIMKPDITFFGEKLSSEFDKQFFKHVGEISVLLVIGTSLKVRPVSEIISHVTSATKIIVINKQPIEHIKADYQILGDADKIVEYLAEHLGYDLTNKEDPGRCLSSKQPVTNTPRKRKGKKVKRRVYDRDGIVAFEGAEMGDYDYDTDKWKFDGYYADSVFDEYTDDEDSDSGDDHYYVVREYLKCSSVQSDDEETV